MSKLLSFRLYVTVASGTDLNLKFLLFCLHFTASITCMYLPVYMYIHVHVFIPIISYMLCTYSTVYLLSSLIVAFMFCVRANTGSPQVYHCRYHQVLIIQFSSEL